MIMNIPNVDRQGNVNFYVPGQPIPSLLKDPKTGKMYVNELKRFVKPYTLTTEPAEILLGPNEQTNMIPMLLDNSGHFEVMRSFFSSQQPEGFTVSIFDPKRRINIQNRELHVSTIASGGSVTTGTGTFSADSSAGRPFVWPESLFIDVEEGGRCIFVTFRNLSASANNIRFALHGLRWYHVQAPSKIADKMQNVYQNKFRTQPYFYTTENHIVLGALGGIGNFDIRFGDDSWSEWVKSMRFASGSFDVRIVERLSGKRLMENALDDSLVFGNGQFPFINWENPVLPPNYKLQFQLANTSGSTNTIWLTLGCRKIYSDPKEVYLARPK